MSLLHRWLPPFSGCPSHPPQDWALPPMAGYHRVFGKALDVWSMTLDRALAYWYTAAVSNAQEASIGVLIYRGAAVPPQGSYKALAQDVLTIYVCPLFNNITPDSEPLVSHRVWGTEEQHASAVFPSLLFSCCRVVSFIQVRKCSPSMTHSQGRSLSS